MNIPSTSTDLILHNGTVTTLDRSNPIATAVAIRDGKFPRVGTDADVRNVRSISPRIRSVRWLGDRCKGTPKWFSYLTPGVFAAALTVIGRASCRERV